MEFWNLVFMQYNQSSDGSRVPLPKPSIDTGAGLERILALLQRKDSVWETDAIFPIVEAAQSVTGSSYKIGDYEDRASFSLRVLAEHARSSTMLVNDGVFPSNEGRGYVQRRIIRRAIRHGHKLGINGPFFHKLVAALREQMGEAYPELQQGGDHATRVLLQEEERFAETLSTGMVLLTEAIDRVQQTAGVGAAVLDGATVFKLYDTYGFPADLTADVARERGLGIDQAGFEAAMEAQRERARAASRFGVDLRAGAQLDLATEFGGYTGTAGESTVIALLCEGELVEALRPGERGEVILARTPFYAESGGQVGDAGELQGSAGSRFIVEDTQKRGTAGAHSHIGRLAEGGSGLKVGDTVSAQVDTVLRGATALNHSATHLLHAALREVLGSHVQQKGSRVAPDRLRFDFSHFQPVTAEELHRIERRVNEQVRLNAAAETREMEYDAAVAAGKAVGLGLGLKNSGLGNGFNEDLMMGMAKAGQGQGYYGDTAEDLLDPFTTEFELMRALCARKLRLSLQTPEGVKAKVLNEYTQEGDGRWAMPDLALGAEGWALVSVTVPARLCTPGATIDQQVLR